MLTGASLLLVGILIGLYIPKPQKELLKKSISTTIGYKNNKKATVVDMTEPFDPEKEI